MVSDVPLAEFGEEALKRNLESLPWLEKVARGHDEVVRAVAACGPAAPLRLATIFHDDDAVRRRLDEWHDALVEVLDRVDGRAEWSVKVLAPAAEARAPSRAGADDRRRVPAPRKAQAERPAPSTAEARCGSPRRSTTRCSQVRGGQPAAARPRTRS